MAMTADPSTLATLAAWPPYQLLVQSGVMGFKPFSQMAPWFLLQPPQMFDANAYWPASSSHGPELKLLAFGRRQDNDDLVCVQIEHQVIKSVIEIEGWQQSSYALLAEYASLDDWLAAIRQDIW